MWRRFWDINREHAITSLRYVGPGAWSATERYKSQEHYELFRVANSVASFGKTIKKPKPIEAPLSSYSVSAT